MRWRHHWPREYKIYGRNRGEKKSKSKYLFTVLAINIDAAIWQAKKRVKGAKVIDRAKWVRTKTGR